MFYACILAGGSGTRLWPISRKSSPKQTQPFIDDKTLLQKTYERLTQKFSTETIWIATGQADKIFIDQQLPQFPKNQLSLEPARRDTAAAIGLATLLIHHADPNSSMININSDAYVVDETIYIDAISTLEQFLEDHPNYIAGLGIPPTHPETGYGYIKRGVKCEVRNTKFEIYEVDEFKEKPDLETAKQYLASGEYLWNPTLFAWKTSTMLELFEQYVPVIYQKLMEIQPYLGTGKQQEMIDTLYPEIEKISIDYAIFERAEHMAVLPVNFGWSDVGSWGALYNLQDKDSNGNVTKGDVVTVNAKNNIIYSQDKKVIAVAGLDNIVVVDTPDALLICDQKNTQQVKDIVEKLKEENQQYL